MAYYWSHCSRKNVLLFWRASESPVNIIRSDEWLISAPSVMGAGSLSRKLVVIELWSYESRRCSQKKVSWFKDWLESSRPHMAHQWVSLSQMHSIYFCSRCPKALGVVVSEWHLEQRVNRWKCDSNYDEPADRTISCDALTEYDLESTMYSSPIALKGALDPFKITLDTWSHSRD